MPPDSPPHHVTPLQVRYAETDRMGVIYHANYLVYCDIGRTNLLARAGTSYRELEASGMLLVVREARVRYVSSATFDDPLHVQTWVTRIGRSRVDFEYKILHPGEKRTVATAFTTLACLDEQHKLRRLPAEVVQGLRSLSEGMDA